MHSTDYSVLAKYYDSLTPDVDYDRFVKIYERIFSKAERKPKLVLDLGCGTGNITVRLSKLGYEMIGVDNSCDMLSQAADKSHELCPAPMYICQKIEDLELYGTVDAAVSCLDSLNYITSKKDLQRVFDKVSLFMNPGGRFIFDIKTASAFLNQDGLCTVKEADSIFCVFESEYSSKSKICTHNIELFEQNGTLWRRSSEIHKQRAYDIAEIIPMLEASGFCEIEHFSFDENQEVCHGRIVFSATKSKQQQKGI